MALNVIDLLIIIFLGLGGVIGYKNGAIKEATKFVGFFVIVIIAFVLKDKLMVVLYKNLPFLSFFGFIRGITAFNILFYQLISFVIIFLALLFLLRVLVVITGLIEWLVKMTVFLSFPSKIIGTVIGVLEYYIYIFIALYVLSIPIFNLVMVNNSKLATTILENTPILSNVVGNTVKVYSEAWDIVKAKEENTIEINTYQTNELLLANLLDNKLISVESTRELIETNKVLVEDQKFLDNYSDDGTFYEKLKSLYPEHKVIFKYRITKVGDKKTENGVTIVVNTLNDRDCSSYGDCTEKDEVGLNVTVSNDTKTITLNIKADGHHHKLEGLDMYVYATIENGWINVGVTE